ncbi:unnamed protein product [Gongylonema pulchrum]|uniref:IgGFc-binding protein N-terminal domain-containing protein n=1 Tax=Gongylonema pulchrum TaxID=637853 RepID=A0A3P6QA92_9BILA|nr:unnamed protein product [Gongylonema pulchrum]
MLIFRSDVESIARNKTKDHYYYYHYYYYYYYYHYYYYHYIYNTYVNFCISTTPTIEIDADSIGTEFVLIFPGNSGGNTSRLPEISVDLINPTSRNATVQILKRRSSTPIAQNVQVPPHSVVKYELDASTYAMLCAGKDSFVRCPDTSIAIQSSNPISVVAHNHLSGVAGDSYTVLPTSMANTTYGLSVPASAPDEQGTAIVYFLPIDKKVTVYVQVFNSTTQNSLTQSTLHLELNDSGTLWAYKRTAQGFVMFVNGTGKFAIVAAVNSLPLSDDEFELSTDFGCFMPTPILDQTCDGSTVLDTHITTLLTTGRFLVTVPAAPCQISVETHTDSGITDVTTVSVKNNIIDLWSIHGNNAAFLSKRGLLQILRYGGYERQTGGYISGAFLDMLPSRTQFVTASTAFSTLSDSNLITIIGDEKTKETAVFDNFYEIVWAPIPYLDEVMYYAASSVPSGYHNVYSEGSYIVFVTGSMDGVAYSFVPTYNSAFFFFLPVTAFERLAHRLQNAFYFSGIDFLLYASVLPKIEAGSCSFLPFSHHIIF